VRVDVAAVNLDVVDAPVGERLRVRLQVAENAGVAAARVVPVILVDAELEAQAVNLGSVKSFVFQTIPTCDFQSQFKNFFID
jgi:hypothetical protein